jgi:carboxyl-terminal processing protease
VGVEITVRDGDIVVISPIEDTPAMKAGLRAGDVITKVNNVAIKNKNISEIVKMIRGLPHTRVTLTVVREGLEEPLTFEIERAPIKIETVRFDILKEHGIGYIKIKTFSAETTREVEKALAELNKKGLGKLIIDLRWNPGGLLDKAISVSELFLDKGKVIVSTRGREGTGNVKEFLSEKSPFYRGRLVVLVNKGSASASEIFSGAMRDNGRGKLVGETTFGKGLVQKFFNLNENVGVTLTIAKYYTPSGASIHGKGITPDYQVPSEGFSEEDKKNVGVILKDRLVEEFVKTHKSYDEGSRGEFIEFLKRKKLPISEKSANYLLKTEIFKYARKAAYDLEFDPQLKKAIEIINEAS